MLDLQKLEETTRKEMLKKFELVRKYGVDLSGHGGQTGLGGVHERSSSNLLKKSSTGRLPGKPPGRNLSVPTQRPPPMRQGTQLATSSLKLS